MKAVLEQEPAFLIQWHNGIHRCLSNNRESSRHKAKPDLALLGTHCDNVNEIVILVSRCDHFSLA